MPFNVGENVGPYRIIEQLGQGGMATVFKAYHASLDRYVAIKALHPAFNQDATFEARFQREARVVAKLEHPNIVPGLRDSFIHFPISSNNRYTVHIYGILIKISAANKRIHSGVEV